VGKKPLGILAFSAIWALAGNIRLEDPTTSCTFSLLRLSVQPSCCERRVCTERRSRDNFRYMISYILNHISCIYIIYGILYMGCLYNRLKSLKSLKIELKIVKLRRFLLIFQCKIQVFLINNLS
jgi:hypothetical protein